ncbi:tRNA (adenosine(37)-N6)-dimethylallyltransferase MiaA, partial [Xanthovirga aplysinae]|uniref:tRNA (adenosine(37)-N6)-dimethylallyltransferase MiaA n=1 Tax=Xanthovirga aplysinae TaxID=2529853 RepID=UPI0012BD20F1
GPTAVGKTDLCIRFANYFKTEIISSDSRQFFIELNIGTAKPTVEEMKGVKHHFVNFLHIDQEYSAGHFERDALKKLDELFINHDVVIMTGGSGMYNKALCEGMDLLPEAPSHFREKLNQEYAEKGLDPLQKMLQDLDPSYYSKVDLNNPQRIIRALEVCLATGKPFSFFQNQNKVERPFHILKIGLEREREELYERINHRMDLMIGKGLFDEAQSLFSKRHLNALQTVGYKEIFDYLEGKFDKEEAIRLLKRNSRRYAKRQMTWFKKDPEIKWFNPEEENKIIDYLEKKMIALNISN